MAKVELFTVCDMSSVLNHQVQLFIDSLNEVLGSSFKQQYLVIVVSVMTQVATLFTDKLVMNNAEGNERFQVIRAVLLLLVCGILTGRATSLLSISSLVCFASRRSALLLVLMILRRIRELLLRRRRRLFQKI